VDGNYPTLPYSAFFHSLASFLLLCHVLRYDRVPYGMVGLKVKRSARDAELSDFRYTSTCVLPGYCCEQRSSNLPLLVKVGIPSSMSFGPFS